MNIGELNQIEFNESYLGYYGKFKMLISHIPTIKMVISHLQTLKIIMSKYT